jgi:hypothetical protein
MLKCVLHCLTSFSFKDYKYDVFHEVVVIKLEDEGLYRGVTKKGYGSKAWEQSSKSQNKKIKNWKCKFFKLKQSNSLRKQW